jgi:hypothetical protein
VNRSPILIALAFLWLSVAAQAKPYSFSLEKPFQASVPLTAKARDLIRLRVVGNNLEVRVKKGLQRLPLETLESDIDRGDVRVDDFNFDGYADIAVTNGSGYGGVNYFYTLYTYQPLVSKFVAINFPGYEGGSLCNPVLRPALRQIEANCKSGPKYYLETFKLFRGRFYRAESGEMILLDGFQQNEFVIYQMLEYAPNGRTIAASLRDLDAEPGLPLRYLPVAKTTLYTAPNAASRTANYIVRGDAIRLVEVRQVGDRQWLRVAYLSRKLGRIVRWISLT